MSNKATHKLIRDPLYGFVSLTHQELEIIDTAIFRRLQFIKQLSHAYVAYPSAIHTRFEHLLGTLHVSDMMAKELCLDVDQTRTVRLSCLLHDIGHGPFSHLFEQVLEKINVDINEPHERISKIMIESDPEIDNILKSDKNGVLELLTRDFTSTTEIHMKSLYADIVSSGLDADKLDYLRRDSYHIGAAYGNFDFHRIIHNIDSTIISDMPANDTISSYNICIDKKGKDALESYRLARYLMHAQVYEHHARLSADQMFLRALDIAINDESVIDKDLLKLKPNNNEEFLKYYKSLNDFSIYEKILQDSEAKISKEILENIRHRKLLKRACEFTPGDLCGRAHIIDRLVAMSSAEYAEMSSEIAEKLGISTHEIIFHKSTINNKLYKQGQLFCKIDENNVDYLDGTSPISGIDTEKFLVFGPANPAKRKDIANEMAKKLGVDVKIITAVD